MNKFATIAIAALGLIPTIAIAGNVSPQRFTRDGQTYVYTTAVEHGRQVIDGYSQDSGARFHLVVRDGQVSGVSNGQPVSFRVAATGNAGQIETASR